jgi:hypothetical protein
MNFLKVWTELDDGKFRSLPAKVVSQNGKFFTIQYLSPTSKKTPNNKRIFNYEEDTYQITDESIVQQVDSELTLGFEETSPGDFIKFDMRYDEDSSDEDYVPSSSDDDDEDSSDEDESEFSEEEEDSFEEEYSSYGEEDE